MNKFKLNAYERKIEAAILRGEYAPIKGQELREIVRAIAARKKNQVLTLRVNGDDIRRIKQMAKSQGIPYQSYLSEVIHRVAMATVPKPGKRAA